MRVTWRSGIVIEDRGREIVLDPGRRVEYGVVSHAHMDHLRAGSAMTRETLDLMRVRLGTGDALPLRYGEVLDYNGFGVSLHPSGHILGSSMVRVEGDQDLVYTGDLNPDGNTIIEKPVPQRCSTLVIESTYGHVSLPKREPVVRRMRSWFQEVLDSQRTAVVTAYELGRAQEVISIANDVTSDVYTTETIHRLCDVHRRHGIHLVEHVIEPAEPPREPHVLVIPRKMLGWAKANYRDALFAHASGWCALYSMKGYDALFALSDHGDDNALLDFVEKSSPEMVLTVHGNAIKLAEKIERRLGIPARPL